MPFGPNLEDDMWLDFGEHNVEPGDAVMKGHPNTVPGYIKWYQRVSHSYIFPTNGPQLPLQTPAHEAEHEAQPVADLVCDDI